MPKFIVLLLLLVTQVHASPLFDSDDCHPKIKSSCPLAPYYQNAGWFNRKVRNTFAISYQGLKDYYQHVSHGLIYENPESYELQDSNYVALTNQSRNALVFMVDYDKKTVYPKDDISPETAEKLFRFSSQMFNQTMGENDFLKSKIKYYNLTRFNRQ